MRVKSGVSEVAGSNPVQAKIKMQTEQDTPNTQKAERIKLGAEVNEIMSLI